ncbi:hypothetical protein OsI_22364 [Oryza sativa Indica Group]|uniref:Ubiquitin-like protease family profile domain-containing protein n=1 Tax=Oryza sativa subsp. indica TaxID=39946 RepID=B8B4I6_ORYSI|nr:hypothetical protein OsI_22364 [Oryza sativa Indica Group]
MESEATEFMLNLLGINDGISPSLTSLGIQLEKLKLADDKHLRMWIIYAISSVLAPTTATTVSPRCYPSVVDAGNIKNLNWCKFVISILQKATKAGKTTNSACLLYMMILYLDSLSFKNLNVPVEGYRATVWTNELINQAILADTSADGSFGALPEKDRIVIAVQNLCEGFSGLVTKFVRQISGLDFVDLRGSQPRKMRMNQKKLAQRTKRVQQDEDLDVTSSDDEDFVADEEEVEDTEEDEYTDEDGDSDDDEDEGEEDDDDEGEEDDDEDRSENDDEDGAKTGRSGEQADAATDVTCCKGDDTNEGIGSGGKGADDVTGCNGDDTNEGIASGGKGADDVIGKGKQVDEGIGQKIIDTGEYYIYLGDLANSVKPMGSLDNNTCELALIVLSVDIKDNSKRIFPARIGGYLLDSQLDRNELKKHFDQTRANHLDHKELAFFPILQELGNGNDKAGHYFMVCLNLKAERFEVYDSLRGEDDEALISASHVVVASIKTMWDRFYMRSSKKTIQNYPLIFIDGPKQDNIQTYPCFVFANKNSRDCGFYMLKFVELWDGKQLPAFEPSNIPNIKKLLTHRMLSFQGNRVQ